MTRREQKGKSNARLPIYNSNKWFAQTFLVTCKMVVAGDEERSWWEIFADRQLMTLSNCFAFCLSRISAISGSSFSHSLARLRVVEVFTGISHFYWARARYRERFYGSFFFLSFDFFLPRLLSVASATHWIATLCSNQTLLLVRKSESSQPVLKTLQQQQQQPISILISDIAFDWNYFCCFFVCWRGAVEM